jgi:hypothetical protein
MNLKSNLPLRLNIMANWLAFLLHILDVLASDINPEAGYPD